MARVNSTRKPSSKSHWEYFRYFRATPPLKHWLLRMPCDYPLIRTGEGGEKPPF
jgi:hypothetical protein